MSEMVLCYDFFVEGEQEAAWLKDAGYGHLVSKLEGTQFLTGIQVSVSILRDSSMK
jgi:hypothetical protein